MPYAHAFSALVANIEAIISSGGYVILFIITLTEGVPVVGMAVPGHIAIVASGFLARIGSMNLLYVIIICSIGAILGDFVGYYIGKKYGLSFIDKLRPYFMVTDSHIEKAKNLLAKHTGKTMIIGRFTPATRALMPFLVGSSGTHASKFWLFNIIGGICWATLSILAGYLFGAGYHAVSGHIGKFAFSAIIFAVLIVWGYRFVNMRFHIFRRYELFTLTLNILSLWALFGTTQTLASRSFKLSFDVWVNGIMYNLDISHPFVSKLAFIITNVGGLAVTMTLGILIGLYLLFLKKWRSSLIMILSICSTAISLGFIKQFFNAERPVNALQTIINDPSFPSGHSAMAAAFFLILAYLLAPKINSWIKREIMLSAFIIAVIAIGLSRLILNVHWASDVIGGWALGVFMATSSILLVRYVSVLIMKKELVQK